MITKIRIPDVLPLFRAYHATRPTWGFLHVVLDDGNLDDSAVNVCIDAAVSYNDSEALVLAELLRSMSMWQRRKLYRIVNPRVAR